MGGSPGAAPGGSPPLRCLRGRCTFLPDARAAPGVASRRHPSAALAVVGSPPRRLCLGGRHRRPSSAPPTPPQDLARAGRSPAVLLDCLRHLGARGLTVAGLFGACAGVDKRKLLALRQLYDSGKRPLKSRAASKDPYLVSAATMARAPLPLKCGGTPRGGRAADRAPAPRTAPQVSNLLLLWLGSLPEPLLPAEALPELLGAQRGEGSTRRSRMLAIRTCLKQTEPFIIEAMYPLFEFLHHWWINQPDREAALQHLGALFAPAVFGSPQVRGRGVAWPLGGGGARLLRLSSAAVVTALRRTCDLVSAAGSSLCSAFTRPPQR